MSSNTPVLYIERTLEKKIRRYLSSPEIIAIVGPRQSGKTTLIHRLCRQLDSAVLLSFEDISLRQLFDEDIKAFARLYLAPYQNVFIDEFQYSRTGGQNLKYLYDFWPGKKIVITGSSAMDLTVKTLGALAGRIFVFELLPLSFLELLHHKRSDIYNELMKKDLEELATGVHPSVLAEITPLWQEFIVYGGYPRVVTAEDRQEKEEVLKNLCLTFLMRDVREILNITDDYKYHTLLKALGLQIGGLISYQELSAVSSLTFRALKAYLNCLEKTYIIRLIAPYFRNKRTELVKSPKAFFWDTGLRNCLVGNFSPIQQRPDKGELYENACCAELLKMEIVPGFWRTKAGAEVDFVWETKGRKIALEVKSKPPPRLPRSLHGFREKYQPDYILILGETAGRSQAPVFFLPQPLLPFAVQSYGLSGSDHFRSDGQ